MSTDAVGTELVGAGSATDAVVVELDPGLAFGTGHHPTTALCLRWLDAVALAGPDGRARSGHATTHGAAGPAAGLAGRRVIDFGCGSGILAIAALKLGAAAAIAIDHDPQALEATAENAERNGVADRLLILSPTQFAALPDGLPAGGPTDIVIANILAGPLVELAPTLTRLTAPGGLLALSGLLAPQATVVAGVYQDAFALEPTEFDEDWALIHGRRLSVAG